MDNRRKGTISELNFAAKALELGWDVCTPLIDEKGYDYVINRGQNWETVQVKTATLYEKRPGYWYTVCDFTNGRGNPRDLQKFDLLAVVLENRCWLIPINEIPGSRYISMTLKLDKYLIS